MKDEKNIKIKQFAIAAKKNTLKRGFNLKTESLQEKEDEKVDDRLNPQQYAMSQISAKKKSGCKGNAGSGFFEAKGEIAWESQDFGTSY